MSQQEKQLIEKESLGLIYGLPTFVTGAACKFKPMLWRGILCWVCSVIAVYTTIKTDLLLTAAAAIMGWFIPGILMERVSYV